MVRRLVELSGMAIRTRINRPDRRSAGGINVCSAASRLRNPEVACLHHISIRRLDYRPYSPLLESSIAQNRNTWWLHGRFWGSYIDHRLRCYA